MPLRGCVVTVPYIIELRGGRYCVMLSGELQASFTTYEGAARWVKRWSNA